MKNILLIRLSAIGDIIFASPLAASIKKSTPNSRISWLVYEGFEPLISSNPFVDEVISVPKNRWRELWRQKRLFALFLDVRGFVRELRKKEFDIALDVQGLLKSGIWAWLSGAGERVGLGSRELSSLFMTRVVPKGGEIKRISSEYLFLAQTLEFDTKDFRLLAPYEKKNRESALQKLPQGLLDKGFVAFCPFTTRAQKHWFEESWIELGRMLQKEGLAVVLLGSKADRESAKNISKEIECINLVGETNLQEALAILDASIGVVGVDTGLTHAGVALNKPTVALFGATRPYLSNESDPYRVIYHEQKCSPCRRRPTCMGRYECMRLIGADEVLGTLKALLGGAS